MSKDNLGNKQTITLLNCLIQSERKDLAITPHRQKRIYLIKKKLNKKSQL